MTDDHSLPPFRALTSDRLRAREEHLLDQIRRPRPRRRVPQLVAAAVVVSAVAAAPALAFSTTVRELVGLKTPSNPFLVATVTRVVVHKPMVTVAFTVGEHGKAPGTGVPTGSDFFVYLVGKIPSRNPTFAATNGSHGRYSATTLLPPGGIAWIQIGGWGNFRSGDSAVDGEFWLPVDAFSR